MKKTKLPNVNQLGMFGGLPEARRPPKDLPELQSLKGHWSLPEYLPDLRGVTRLGIDTETKDTELSDLGPGVRRPGNHIVGLCMAADDWKTYLPIRHPTGNLDINVVLPWARETLNNFEGEVVGASLVYDLDFLAQEGITFPKVKRFLDVQNAEPLIDENRYEYGLDALGRDYIGDGKNEEFLKHAAHQLGLGTTNREIKSNLWRLPGYVVGPYGEEDAALPLQILALQEKKLAEEDLTELFDVESRLVPLLLAMRRRGVKVNLERAEHVRKQLVIELADIMAELKRQAGHDVQLMAPESFTPHLESLGFQVPRTPKTHQPSIKKGFLERNYHNPFVKLIKDGRALNTVINTFIDGHVLGHHINGRIHGTFNQLKGESGGTIARFSSQDPNLQNLPARDEKLGPLVRSIFEPEEGEVWEKDDYSQIEYRFNVHYAVGPGADDARYMYNSDPKTDFHKLCAHFCGIDPEDKYARKKVKQINFAKTYGAQTKKLSETMNCSFEEAQKFVTLYEDKLPWTVETFNRAEETAQRKGYIRTILKRRRRFPLWAPADDYKANAYPLEQAKGIYKGKRLVRANTYKALSGLLQGGAADLMKKSMVNAWEAGVCNTLGAFLVTVHDELGTSVPKTKAGDEAAAELRWHMENAVKLRVPVIADSERGPNWGECK